MTEKSSSEHEQLKARIEKIKSWVPFTMGELLKMKLPKSLFLVESLIPEQGLAVISGHPGNCKSWVLLHIAQCVATGKPVFGKFETKKGNVLVFDEETGVYETSKRIKMTKPTPGIPVHIFLDKGIKVDDPAHLEKIIEIIKEKDIKLVIFDPFVSIHNKLENSSDEIQRVVEALRKLTVEGVTILFAHHNRKEQNSGTRRASSQNMRGSSALWAGVNSHLDIVKTDENNNETMLTINQHKLRNYKAIKPFKIKMVEENKLVYFDYLGEIFGVASLREKTKTYVMQKLTENQELDASALFNEKVAGKSLFNEIFVLLEESVLIKSRKGPHGKKFYSKIEPPKTDS
ncbi:MAG: AAA family ATPase [Candidatus Staskawiczbacteria bacterium]|nr:AAA family ATPase [Candidatus Staskawiczbacteria bacterium]